MPRPAVSRLFRRGSRAEVWRVADVLRTETTGGLLLVGAAAIALLWANSPWRDSYFRLSDLTVGPAALHLDLSLAQWAADGLLAVFFFVAGLELKREFVAGDLRDPRRAALPVAAAVSGMAVPAGIYLTVAALGGGGGLTGWAVPTATDIAFALAVLAVISTHLPAALRLFLLTLAVVDDLLAIIIIAAVYTQRLDPVALALAALPLAAFAVLVQRRISSWWLLVPLGLLTWGLVHASGVHATVAGVLLGFTVPVARRSGTGPGPAERFEHVVRPVSAGFAVPVFAFFAAGVTIVGGGGPGAALADPVTLGIIAGLVIGKPVGVLGGTWLVQRTTRAELADGLSWWDLLGVAQLAGIGFTVSLLIGELAFGVDGGSEDHMKIGVLSGSLLSALLATLLLRARNAHYRRLCAGDAQDPDAGRPAG